MRRHTLKKANSSETKDKEIEDSNYSDSTKNKSLTKNFLAKPLIPRLNINQISGEGPSVHSRFCLHSQFIYIIFRSSKRQEATRSASTRSTRLSGAYSNSFEFFMAHSGIYLEFVFRFILFLFFSFERSFTRNAFA